jgi:hypothetical protein
MRLPDCLSVFVLRACAFARARAPLLAHVHLCICTRVRMSVFFAKKPLLVSQKAFFLIVKPVFFSAHTLQVGDLRALGSAVGSLGAAYGSVGRYDFCACARSGACVVVCACVIVLVVVSARKHARSDACVFMCAMLALGCVRLCVCLRGRFVVISSGTRRQSIFFKSVRN